MYQRILVALDDSAPGQRALEEAIQLAREQRAKLQIVHVIVEGPVVSPDVPSVNLGEADEELRASGRALLELAAAKASRAGVEADTALLEDMGYRPGPRIVEQVKEWRPDLIVCGTHGRRGVQRLVLGSDSEYIVRHTPVPVLLVRGREQP